MPTTPLRLSTLPSHYLPLLIAGFGMGLVLLPIIPGLVSSLAPAFAVDVWHDLLRNPQFPAALSVTLSSALLSTGLALCFAIIIMVSTYPSRHWQRLQRQLPLLLAFPHAAFAIGLAFLLAPSGWLARVLANALDWAAPPQWVTIQDPAGLSLTLALAIKESWFLLWMLSSLLQEQTLTRQLLQAQSMGYRRWQIWWQILLPQLLPRMGWVLLAIFAYGLSVVDMAIVLGPSTPPTLAVLGWQWFNDPQIEQQAAASAIALLLIALLLAGLVLGNALMALYRWLLRMPTGRRYSLTRQAFRHGSSGLILLNQLPGWMALCLLALWSLANGWFFPNLLPSALTLTSWLNADYSPLFTTLLLAVSSAFIALPICLLWLEWGPKQSYWIYLPLVLPALPLAAAQYYALLALALDNTLAGVIWSHLAWVVPYMTLVLAGPYRAFDTRYLLTAQTMGHSRMVSCWRIKWPMLLKPILAALAVGIAVSVAQYLPTLFAGGGRFETITTEAVALSAGGNRRTLATQAFLQAVLPMLAFAISAVLTTRYLRQRKGLH